MTKVLPVLPTTTPQTQPWIHCVGTFPRGKINSTKHLPQYVAMGTSRQTVETEKETGKGADSWIRLYCVY